MKNIKRARQALAQDQTAWNSTMHRNKGKEFIASKVHYVLSDETLACGLEWLMENVGCDDIADVTCNACITAHADIQQTEKEESMASKQTATITLYTLAPASLDTKKATSVTSAWMYHGFTEHPQALRQVIVPAHLGVAQMHAYTTPVPYIAMDEAGLLAQVKHGHVTKSNTQGIAFDPIKAAIELSNNKKEDPSMPRTKIEKLPARTAKVEALRTRTPQVPAIKDLTPLGVVPAPSALDAILAKPIVESIKTPFSVTVPAPVVPANTPEGRQNAAILELKARMDTAKTPLALPQERSEKALVQAMAPDYVPAYSLAHDPVYVQLAQRVQGLQHKVESLEARLFLAEQGERVAATTLTMADMLSNVWGSMLGSVAMPAQAPVVPDAWGEMLGNMDPVKPKSTLQIFAGGTTSPQPARQGGSKTDPAIIKAIQQAWRDKTHTQAQLASKYNMDDKKIWYFCSSRCKQYV